jgi:hypothetical protein
MSETDRDSENFSESTSAANVEAISLLRQTIDKLQGIVTQLEAESFDNLSSTSFATLLDSTDKIASEIKSLSPNRVTDSPDTEEIKELDDFIDAEKGVDRVVDAELQTSHFGRERGWWGKNLLQIRGFLPSSVSDFLPDSILTGILASVAVVFVFISINLLPSFPSSSPLVSTTTPTSSEVTESPAPTTELPTTEIQPGTENTPTKKPSEKSNSVPLELTPEQSLVASIQKQVAEITDRYSAELISAIEADFLGGRLLVTVTDKWRELRIGRQEKLANEMLDRSHRLDFRKLEIIDKDRTVLARSPVVGNKMVLLQNSDN